MLDINSLPKTTLDVHFREKRSGIYKVLVPFLHEDGDMYDIFLEESPDSGLIRISDKGLTLMKLSYSFEIDTENKKEILRNIVHQNQCSIEDDEIYLECRFDQFTFAIYQFAQVISKVMNMEILTREVVRSMFMENLNKYVCQHLKGYLIDEHVAPLSDTSLYADYSIRKEGVKNVIYLFGVNDNPKASRVIITCFNFQKSGLPYRSLVVHENFDALNSFNRTQITNVADKQFTSFNDFTENNASYINRELMAANM